MNPSMETRQQQMTVREGGNINFPGTKICPATDTPAKFIPPFFRLIYLLEYTWELLIGNSQQYQAKLFLDLQAVSANPETYVMPAGMRASSAINGKLRASHADSISAIHAEMTASMSRLKHFANQELFLVYKQ